MTNYDVIKKLLGPINPQGESNTDKERYENLEATIEVVNQLIGDVINVSHNRTRHEMSMREAGQKAYGYLAELYEGLMPSKLDVLASAPFMEALEHRMAKKLHEDMEKMVYTAQPGSTLDIIWNKTDWVCTDPDNQQYGRKLYTGAYEFKEWDHNTHVLANVDIGSDKDLKWKKENFDNDDFWIRETILLMDYTDAQIEEYISGYYDSLEHLEETCGESWEWIVAECIFEVESGLYLKL